MSCIFKLLLLFFCYFELWTFEDVLLLNLNHRSFFNNPREIVNVRWWRFTWTKAAAVRAGSRVEGGLATSQTLKSWMIVRSMWSLHLENLFFVCYWMYCKWSPSNKKSHVNLSTDFRMVTPQCCYKGCMDQSDGCPLKLDMLRNAKFQRDRVLMLGTSTRTVF